MNLNFAVNEKCWVQMTLNNFHFVVQSNVTEWLGVRCSFSLCQNVTIDNNKSGDNDEDRRSGGYAVLLCVYC